MAKEDSIDQLIAEIMANRIILMRLWAYFATLASASEAVSFESYVERQCKESIESVEYLQLDGHPNAEGLRKIVRDAISVAFRGLANGTPTLGTVQ
jgi:hypothetical protein